MFDTNYSKKVFKRIVGFIFSIIGIYILFKLSIFYIPFLIAVIIAMFLEPIIRKMMQKTNFRRKTCVIIILIITFAMIMGLLTWGVFSLINEASIVLDNFNNIVESINIKINDFINWINLKSFNIPLKLKDILIEILNNFFERGSSIAERILNNIISFFKNLPKMGICFGITVLATYFICSDRIYMIDQLEHHIPKDWVLVVGEKIKKSITSIGEYLKAQAILIFVSFIIVLLGLYIFKISKMNIKYPMLMALFIGIVDAMPVLGSGTVMIPWAVIVSFNGDIKLGLSIIILYAIVTIIRQVIEPKIVSGKIGIHPIFTLISMYTGFKTIGIVGIFIGPIILIILKNIFEGMIDNGFLKTIFDKK